MDRCEKKRVITRYSGWAYAKKAWNGTVEWYGWKIFKTIGQEEAASTHRGNATRRVYGGRGYGEGPAIAVWECLKWFGMRMGGQSRFGGRGSILAVKQEFFGSHNNLAFHFSSSSRENYLIIDVTLSAILILKIFRRMPENTPWKFQDKSRRFSLRALLWCCYGYALNFWVLVRPSRE